MIATQGKSVTLVLYSTGMIHCADAPKTQDFMKQHLYVDEIDEWLATTMPISVSVSANRSGIKPFLSTATIGATGVSASALSPRP